MNNLEVTKSDRARIRVITVAFVLIGIIPTIHTLLSAIPIFSVTDYWQYKQMRDIYIPELLMGIPIIIWFCFILFITRFGGRIPYGGTVIAGFFVAWILYGIDQNACVEIGCLFVPITAIEQLIAWLIFWGLVYLVSSRIINEKIYEIKRPYFAYLGFLIILLIFGSFITSEIKWSESYQSAFIKSDCSSVINDSAQEKCKTKFIAERNENGCKTIQHHNRVKTCLEDIATLRNIDEITKEDNPEKCFSSNIFFQRECLGEIALKRNDVTICEKDFYCKTKFTAITTKDSLMCEKLDYSLEERHGAICKQEIKLLDSN